MNTREQILNFIDEQHFNVGFVAPPDFQPTLAFKLTNHNSNTSDSFSVNSVDEAKDLVISFISTANRDEIFSNDFYNEDKELFLRVGVKLPI
uniref:hypothetical protein n=1 Tax=Gelidibacter sp. TaxID=2018083 RepID=UPI0040491209